MIWKHENSQTKHSDSKVQVHHQKACKNVMSRKNGNLDSFQSANGSICCCDSGRDESGNEHLAPELFKTIIFKTKLRWTERPSASTFYPQQMYHRMVLKFMTMLHH